LAFKVFFKSSVKKDLRKIAKKDIKRIIEAIAGELAENPNRGKRSTGEYSGLFSYRIGDYRAIYTALKDGILVLRIGHRKDVYK
jgi:mRNA interferase RelE/StbE